MNSRPMTENEFNPDVLNDIKNSIDRAEEKGLIEGEKKGLIKVAKRLLLSGMDIEFVAGATGLSTEEINRIKEEIKTSSSGDQKHPD